MLHWGLKGNLPESPGAYVEQTVPAQTSVMDVLCGLGIPAEKVGLIVINGSAGKTDYILRYNDDVEFYPPLEGG